ncbi:SDR family oxidoreductase [Flavobacteriales bacterium]|nr:SDR family oxidoreductase [Flavobacteriales bacterium]
MIKLDMNGKNNKVVVIGASGYIGSRLSLFLGNNGYEVFAFDKHKNKKADQWLKSIYHFTSIDIRDKKFVQEVKGLNPDYIVNLVSLNHIDSEKDKLFTNEINVNPTLRLLECLSTTKNLKYINLSTVQVYGNQTGLIKETNPLNPNNFYALTHKIREDICNYYNNKGNISCINLRLSNSYGSPIFIENSCWWLVINDFCRSATQNKKIKLNSDGSPLRDFIHGDNVCSYILEILKDDNQFSTYNICSGVSKSIAEIAIRVREEASKKLSENVTIINKHNEEIYLNTPKPGNSIIKRYDNSRIKNLKAREVSMGAGISEVLDYCLKMNKS